MIVAYSCACVVYVLDGVAGSGIGCARLCLYVFVYVVCGVCMC